MPPATAAPAAPRRNARHTPLAVDGPLPAEMVRAVPAIRRDPPAWLERLTARYGDLVALPLPRTPVLIVATVDGARRILVESAPAWTKDTAQYRSLGLVTGTGLLTADGETWRARRRLAQPAFSRDRLADVAVQAVAAAERMRAAWPADGAVADADAAALRASLEVVGRTLFGRDVGADGERLVAAVLAALEVVVARARTPVPLPAWAPTPGQRRLRAARATLDEACAGLVAARRARGEPDADEGDLLGLLLAAQRAGDLDAAAVRDELVTTVIAGHETVASSLVWTLHLLATHPGEQAAVHAELDAVLAGRAPTADDLGALRRTRAVVDESLRLYPPAWVVSRRAARDDVVSGVEVPAGTLAVVSPWLLHRRADVHPDPLRFDPGRFLGGGSRAVPSGGYLPFGAGPRLCIGRDFALVEQVLVLAALLRDRAVAPVPGHRVVVDALVTLRPRGGLPLRLHTR